MDCLLKERGFVVRLKGIRQLTVDKSDCELEVILANQLGPIYKVVSCIDSQQCFRLVWLGKGSLMHQSFRAS